MIRKRATSRHKNDRRDAELILELLMRDEFPSLWRRHRESDQVLEILRLRQILVSQRTQVYNRLTALAMVHTVGDVSRFSRLAKQVTGFVGLDPLERSSAGKVRFGSISKAGSPLLRYQLGMSALIATRFDARLKSFYKRLAKKKPKAVAKTAVARKLLVKLSIMLRDNITADEFDIQWELSPTRPLSGRTVGNARGPQGLQ